MSFTLYTCCFCWISSWCYSVHFRCVFRSNRCTVLIDTFNINAFSITFELRFRSECHFAIRINSISTFARNSYFIDFITSSRINQLRCNIFIDRYIWVSAFKCRCARLRLALRSFRLSWCTYRFNRRYVWRISCLSWCTISIDSFNFNRSCFTNKFRFRSECYSTIRVCLIRTFARDCQSIDFITSIRIN